MLNVMLLITLHSVLVNPVTKAMLLLAVQEFHLVSAIDCIFKYICVYIYIYIDQIQP